MTTVTLLRALFADFAAFATAFLVINAGLRLSPEGRRFLAAARARGRLLAGPGPESPATVRAIFGLSWVAAAAAGALAWAWSARWAPLPLPAAIRLAEAGA